MIESAGSMTEDSSDIRYYIKPPVANRETDPVAKPRYAAFMPNPAMAKWLKLALKHSRLNQPTMADRLTAKLKRSFDKSTVNKMTVCKRNVSADEMYAISEITGFPLPEDASKFTSVPLIDWVAAGQLSDPKSQIQIEDVPLLAFADLGRGDYFATKVRGDSMDRISPEDSVIIVNKADRTLVAGKPYVFSDKGETTYKLWQPGDPAYLAPHSTNPIHKPIFIKKRKDLEVVGRVKRTILDL